MDYPQKTRRIKWAAMVLIVPMVAGTVTVMGPPTVGAWYPKCIFHHVTGLHCPGCGTTRAIYSLCQADFANAFRCNPLLIFGGPIVAVLLYRQAKRRTQGYPVSSRLAWVMVVLLVVYSLCRNLPSPQRSWLAPPEKIHPHGQTSPQVDRPKTPNVYVSSPKGAVHVLQIVRNSA